MFSKYAGPFCRAMHPPKLLTRFAEVPITKMSTLRVCSCPKFHCTKNVLQNKFAIAARIHQLSRPARKPMNSSATWIMSGERDR